MRFPLVFSLVTLFVGVAHAQTGKPVAAIDRAAAEAAKKSGLRVAAPAVFPDLRVTDTVFASVGAAKTDEYEIALELARDCNAATACWYGSLTGKRGANLPNAKAVALANGISGVFVEAKCGASCGDAVVYWKQGEIRYSVGLKAGSEQNVVRMANSAIP